MSLWTAAERAAWMPAEDLSGSEWAAKHRVLGPDESAVPGPWDPELAPYLNGVMDALADDVHQVVTMMAGAQCGKSEAGRNWVGRSLHLQPDPTMIVFPTQSAAEETIDERIKPMIQNTPALAALQTGRAWDVKKGQIKLSACRVFIGWATSAQSLATRPIRYLYLDEVDKYPASTDSGKEGDPITLGMLRLTTYKHRAKAYICSTPTNRFGPVYQAYQSSGDRRRYHVPCPHCGELQELLWERFRFTGYGSTTLAEWRLIAAEAELGLRDVHYLCAHCEERIEEAHKAELVRRGQWVSEGHPPGEHPESSTIAFTISSLYSPWVSWTKIVAEHFEARLKGAVELHGWINGRLGKIAEDESTQIHADLILRKATRGHRAEVVPDWAVGLVASADTQKDGWWVTVRAWGRSYRSRLMGWAFCPEESDLLGFSFKPWAVEGCALQARAVLLLVDAGGAVKIDGPDGTTTDRVYRIAASDPQRIKPVKGHGGQNRAPARLRKASGGKELPPDVELHMVCTQTYKDLLSSRIRQDEPEVWEVTAEADMEYAQHLASEQRVMVTKGSKTMGVWTPISKSAPNHLWDAETYNCAGADMLEVDTRRTFAEQRTELARRAQEEHEVDRYEHMDGPAGWWTGARGGQPWVR